MEQQNDLRTYTAKERNAYLTGLAGQNVVYNVISVMFSNYFLQNVLYIPAITVGIINTCMRMWDAVNDFVMGTFVDRTRSKWGKCRPYLLFVPVPIGIITILGFVNGTYDSAAGITARNIMIVAWAVLVYLCWDIAYTIGDIPLWGIISLMSEKEKDRQKLIFWAKIFTGVGAGITVFALQPVALAVSQYLTKFIGDISTATKYGFLLVAAGFTVIGTAAYQMAGVFVREKITAPASNNNVAANFKMIWNNKPFRQLLLSGIIGAPKSLLMVVAIPLVTYYYSNKDGGLTLFYTALLGGSFMLGQFAISPFVPRMLTRISKKNLYIWSNIMAAVPCVLMFLLYLSGPDKMTSASYLTLSVINFIVNGIAGGITSMLFTFMTIDAVDYEEHKNNIRPDGVFFAGSTFLGKAGAGMASIIYGIACRYAGFSGENIRLLDLAMHKGLVVRTAMMMDPQIKGYITMMFFVVTIPVAISAVLCVIPLLKYALSDEEHNKILDELNQKRHSGDLDALRQAIIDP